MTQARQAVGFKLLDRTFPFPAFVMSTVLSVKAILQRFDSDRPWPRVSDDHAGDYRDRLSWIRRLEDGPDPFRCHGQRLVEEFLDQKVILEKKN